MSVVQKVLVFHSMYYAQIAESNWRPWKRRNARHAVQLLDRSPSVCEGGTFEHATLQIQRPPTPLPKQTVVLEHVRQALRIPSSNYVRATCPRRQHDRYPVGGNIKIEMTTMHRML